MKISETITTTAFLGVLLLSTRSAAANTAVMTAGWLQGVSDEQCIETAKKVASIAGFTEATEVVKGEAMQDFYGYTKKGPYALAISCNSDYGASSLAVSGISSDGVYKMYNKVLDAYQKID